MQIHGEKTAPGPIWGHFRQFFPRAKNMQKLRIFFLFSLVGQWALFTRFGEKVAIFLLPSVASRSDGRAPDSCVCQGFGRLVHTWNYLFPHLGWIAARAHQGRSTEFLYFFDFSGLWKNGLRWAQMGPGGFFPTNPDLADILGRTDLNSDNFYVLFFGPQVSGFPGPQISKFLDFQVPRSPNSQISKFPDFQVPRFPDAAAGCAAGRTLRSQPDPSPNAPRDQIRRKGPCCDYVSLFKNSELADEVSP